MAVQDISRSAEDRRETGLSLIIVGVMVWCFDALVFFFMPAGTKIGYQRPFAIITLSMLVVGLVLIGFGAHMRRE